MTTSSSCISCGNQHQSGAAVISPPHYNQGHLHTGIDVRPTLRATTHPNQNFDHHKSRHHLSTRSTSPLPDSYVWIADPKLKSADQGKCGCCWIMGSVGSLAARYVLHGLLPVDGALSQLQALALTQGVCKTGDGCGGGTPSDAYDCINKNGGLIQDDAQACPASDFNSWFASADAAAEQRAGNSSAKDYETKYTAALNANLPDKSLIDKCKTAKVFKCGPPIAMGLTKADGSFYDEAEYDKVDWDALTSVQNEIKRHILDYGPGAITYLVYGDFMSAQAPATNAAVNHIVGHPEAVQAQNWQSTGGIYVHGAYDELHYSVARGQYVQLDQSQARGTNNHITTSVAPSADIQGGHCVMVGGWGVDKIKLPGYADPVPVEYWICMNSWSDKWGDQGAFKMAMNTNKYKINGKPLNWGIGIELPLYVTMQGSKGLLGGMVFAHPLDKDGNPLPPIASKSMSASSGATSGPSFTSQSTVIVILLLIICALVAYILYSAKRR